MKRRYVLSETEFKDLVAGHVVQLVGGVEIVLREEFAAELARVRVPDEQQNEHG